MSYLVRMDEEAHSARQFTPSRDFWWHADYLDLLARRLDLARCRSVLELGAGVGLWTAQLIGRCAENAAFTVVDREAAWVDRLRTRFAGRAGFTAIQADVADLSAIQGPFDLVTCQTVLMHLPDVPAALDVMRRLLSPGGLLVLAEPNNFLNRLPQTSTIVTLTAAEYGRLAALWWAFERGREALGFGREWIAEMLPKMLVDGGFKNVRVYQNDRVWPWMPPYDSEEVGALRSESAEPADDGFEPDEARRFALAGGLDPDAFEGAWRLHQELQARAARAVDEASFSAVGSAHSYIFAARRW